MRVHVWFRLEVKHVGSLPHRLRAAGKQQRKDRFSDESVTGQWFRCRLVRVGARVTIWRGRTRTA